MKLADAPKPSPGAGQALVKIAAIWRELHRRLFSAADCTQGRAAVHMGSEASGTVESGCGWRDGGQTRRSRGLRDGAGALLSEYALVPADQPVSLPDGIDMQTAGAAMLQGMTAHYLTHSTWPVKPADKVLGARGRGRRGAADQRRWRKCSGRWSTAPWGPIESRHREGGRRG